MLRLRFISLTINLFLTILIIMLYCSKTEAQNLKTLEIKYDSLNVIFQQQQTKLDSLNQNLKARVQQINDEKSKQNPNKDKITRLMASSVTISNKVDLQQKTVDKIEVEIELVKKPLNEKYSLVIDSLNSLLKIDKKNTDKDKIRSEIVLYTEKKLKVAPKISLLSFHPEKILEINLNNISNPSERKMYGEYLQKALAEINNRLENVDNQSKEVEQIIELKKKTKRFLEETEFESNVRPQSLTYKTTPNYTDNQGYGSSPTDLIGSKGNASYTAQAISYSFLLNQLNINRTPESKIKWDTFFEGKNSNISVEEYGQLLKDVKKRLDEYKLVLVHKLGKN